jgi:hypothetical protein
MVHTTFQSQIHGFKPLDTIKKVKCEHVELEDEQKYFLERCHPPYELHAPTAKGVALKLKTGSEGSDVEDGEEMMGNNSGAGGVVGDDEDVNVMLMVEISMSEQC